MIRTFTSKATGDKIFLAASDGELPIAVARADGIGIAMTQDEAKKIKDQPIEMIRSILIVKKIFPGSQILKTGCSF